MAGDRYADANLLVKNVFLSNPSERIKKTLEKNLLPSAENMSNSMHGERRAPKLPRTDPFSDSNKLISGSSDSVLSWKKSNREISPQVSMILLPLMCTRCQHLLGGLSVKYDVCNMPSVGNNNKSMH